MMKNIAVWKISHGHNPMPKVTFPAVGEQLGDNRSTVQAIAVVLFLLYLIKLNYFREFRNKGSQYDSNFENVP